MSRHTVTVSLLSAMLRGQLRSLPANGYAAFLPQIRKIVFEFCEKWPSSANTRSFLQNHLQPLARQNPHVEIVVKQRNHKEPIVRGFYGECTICMHVSSTNLGF
jgi:large subunit ribosomal protein L43